jgi:hypothetical protein
MRVLNWEESIQFYRSFFGSNISSGPPVSLRTAPNHNNGGRSRVSNAPENTQQLGGSRGSDGPLLYIDVPLVDPTSHTRLRLPCRGFDCAHLQCFDFSSVVNETLFYQEQDRWPFTHPHTLSHSDVYAQCQAGQQLAAAHVRPLKGGFSRKCPICGSCVADFNIYVDIAMLAILKELSELEESILSTLYRLKVDLSVQALRANLCRSQLSFTGNDTDESSLLGSRILSLLDLARTFQVPTGISLICSDELPKGASMEGCSIKLTEFSTPSLSITSFHDVLYFLNGFSRRSFPRTSGKIVVPSEYCSKGGVCSLPQLFPVPDECVFYVKRMRPFRAVCWRDLEQLLRKLPSIGSPIYLSRYMLSITG